MTSARCLLSVRAAIVAQLVVYTFLGSVILDLGADSPDWTIKETRLHFNSLLVQVRSIYRWISRSKEDHYFQ